MSLNFLYSIIIGIVQGVSEWLPISSKTQVLFVSTALFGLTVTAAYAFGLFMEIGSLGSAIIYFRRDIRLVFRDKRLLKFLFVVTIMTGIVGVPLLLIAEKLLSNAYNLGIPIIILGVVLLFDGIYIGYSRTAPRFTGHEQMKMKHYIVIGIAQGIAALPGVSRSGITVSTMLLMGVKPEVAFRLSYLAYIPASFGAFLATLILSRQEINSALAVVEPTGVLIAIVAALLVGLAVISYLLRFAKKRSIYIVDLVLGIIALVIGIITLFSGLPTSAG